MRYAGIDNLLMKPLSQIDHYIDPHLTTACLFQSSARASGRSNSIVHLLAEALVARFVRYEDHDLQPCVCFYSGPALVRCIG
jgi:hypothetical protein